MSSARLSMHAGEAVVEALAAEGVERVYSVPGSHIHPIYDALSRVNSIQLITCKMEPNVSLMAEAHAGSRESRAYVSLRLGQAV